MATGKYTNVDHRTTKAPQPQNLARSGIAPEMSAGVMTANISWNIAKANSGILSGSVPIGSVGALPSPRNWKLPISPANESLPKVSENP